MLLRAVILAGALLASPAWTQEPAPTFDLRSDTIKQIVRDTAATQFRAVEPVREEKSRREPFTRIVFTSPRDAAREQPPAPPRAPPPKPLSPLLSAVIDSLLDVEPGFAEEARDSYLQLCRALDPDKSPTQRSLSCPSTGPP